jgi:peptidoglycan endopeptidase LytE
VNTYIVQRGDTLYGISKKYNTSVQSIKELNNLKSDKLDIGQKLILSENNDTNPIECITYIVKKGDTIFMGNNEYIHNEN